MQQLQPAIPLSSPKSDSHARGWLLGDDEDPYYTPPPGGLLARLEWVLIQYLDMVQPWSLHSRRGTSPHLSTFARLKIYVSTWPRALSNSHLWTAVFGLCCIVAGTFALIGLVDLADVVPDIRKLQSDATILMHNDLYGTITAFVHGHV